MENFIENLKFTDGFIKLFEKVFVQEWQKRSADSLDESTKAEEHLANLKR